MRGVVITCWLFVRYPWTMLAVYVHRGLLWVDADAAAWWFEVSGLFAAARRCEVALRKIGSA